MLVKEKRLCVTYTHTYVHTCIQVYTQKCLNTGQITKDIHRKHTTQEACWSKNKHNTTSK